jgi:hypothetical protein
MTYRCINVSGEYFDHEDLTKIDIQNFILGNVTEVYGIFSETKADGKVISVSIPHANLLIDSNQNSQKQPNRLYPQFYGNVILLI